MNRYRLWMGVVSVSLCVAGIGLARATVAQELTTSEKAMWEELASAIKPGADASALQTWSTKYKATVKSRTGTQVSVTFPKVVDTPSEPIERAACNCPGISTTNKVQTSSGVLSVTTRCVQDTCTYDAKTKTRHCTYLCTATATLVLQ